VLEESDLTGGMCFPGIFFINGIKKIGYQGDRSEMLENLVSWKSMVRAREIMFRAGGNQMM
jgi:hypothetical protein